jgi:rhamnosyltransferase subunit B
MARIVLATFGSLGDLHPTLALALELRRRGHDAVIATSEPYRAKVTALGLLFAPVRPDLSLANPELVARVMDGRRGSEYLMRELVYPSIRDMYADLLAACTGADFLLASELACAAPLVAVRLRLPWAFFALSPISFFSVFDPVVLPGPAFIHRLQQLGPFANRMILHLARAASYTWWAPLRKLRRELGLPPTPSPLFAGKYSPHLNFALFSPLLQSPQPDWPAKTRQPGFCFFDESPAAAASPPPLPPAVAAFLAGGPAPLVFTLGSAAVQLAENFYNHSAQAAQQLGRRTILLLGKNPPPLNLPPSILAWDYLPYAAIFPHAAAIIHQGGVGTTAQALRAGRPMLIVPFAHDQFDNAARIVRLGVGRTLSRRHYSPTTCAATLADLLASFAAGSAAARIADRLRDESGVIGTCDDIERAFPSPRPLAPVPAAT